MNDLIVESVGLGLVVSLFFSELFGLAAGGMVVPGYLAIFMWNPVKLFVTIAASFVTLGLVKILAKHTLLFGRRKMVMTVLLGFLAGYSLRFLPAVTLGPRIENIEVIGFIIPGLVAYWMDRQGILETLTMMSIASVSVRFLLVIFNGGVQVENLVKGYF
ncbi:poly-gamma-glutamate biosynthesis protein PgsC [bacterium]|nr:poly-gamma-glutamate biosynthesis protein PgsC [bacterium]